MSYFLFLDDMRDLSDVTWVNLPMGNWHIVRNYRQFVNKIQTEGLPIRVSFDHDLSDEHYSDQSGVFSSAYKEKTGADCARWLTNYCFERDLNLPKYTIHSMNRVGSENIKSILESYIKIKSRNYPLS